LLTAALAATLISSSAAQATIRLANDPGGLIAAYEARFARARATHERIVIDGSCLSACTLAIGMVPREQICATPRAVLGFHAAWQPTPYGKAISAPATQQMMSIYPPEIRAWIGRHGGLRPNLIYLRSPELAEFVPACTESEIQEAHNVTTHRAHHHPRSTLAFRSSRYRVFAVRPYYY